MLSIFLAYYGITLFISIFMTLECFDFALSYLSFKEWTIKNIIGLPFLLGILTILLIICLMGILGELLRKLEPILNKKLFK